MKLKKLFFTAIVLLSFLGAAVFSSAFASGENSMNKPAELSSGEDIPDLKENNSVKDKDIIIFTPGEDNITVKPDEICGNSTSATNLTGIFDNNKAGEKVEFQDKKTNISTIARSVKTGVKITPVIIHNGISGTAPKFKISSPEETKTYAGIGIGMGSSFINGLKDIFTPSPAPGEGEVTSGPKVNEEQFVATTVLSTLVMMFAAVFSSAPKYPVFVPLYSRISRDEVLENETRREIYGLIAGNPGTDLLTIKRTLDLSNGTTAHHIRTLERERFLRSVRDGRYRRFFVQGTQVQKRSTVELRILEEIEANPNVNQSQLARKTNMTRQAMNYHIRKLEKKGLISTRKNGRETVCRRSDF